MSLRILQVLTPALHPNRGGVQMSTVKLARYFSSREIDSAVFSFAASGHAPPECLRLFSAKEPGGTKRANNAYELQSTLRTFDPHIVINHMPYEERIGSVLSADSRPYVLLACLRNTLFSVKGDLESFIKATTPRLAWPALLNRTGKKLILARHRHRHAGQLRRILDTYDRFVMFGPPNLDELRYFVPEFDPDRIALIPNSIPAVATSVPEKQKRILWLGRVARAQKRVELIPEIWSRTLARLPDWRLDIVGDGPDLEWLKARVHSMGLERISFHGRQVPDSYFARSAIFLMTSSFEGFPNTLVEAQSQGAVPVIFDSYPVARWIVENGANGWLVEPFDIEAMSRKLVELAESSDLPEMGAAAIQSARRFLINNVGLRWETLFNEELGKRARPQIGLQSSNA